MTSHHNTNNSPPPLLYGNQNSTSSSSSSSPPSPFHQLAPDCIHVILHHHIFHLHQAFNWRKYHELESIGEERSVYELETDDGIRNSNDWNFLTKFAHCCNYYGNKGLEEFLAECRDMECKPAFFHLTLCYMTVKDLVDNGSVEYLRGVSGLHLRNCRIHKAPDFGALFRNIRGVQKFSVQGYGDEFNRFDHHLENLRGIQEAYFHRCDFTSMPDNAFENLRGIQSLTCDSCVFQPSMESMKNLRGIKKLGLVDCEGISLSSEEFENIRGVQIFSLCADTPLTDQHLIHLRGASSVQLELYKATSAVTNAGIVNLRGVEEVVLFNFPQITSAATSNLRGVKELYIVDCPGIEFGEETLINLRGIKSLNWWTWNTYHKKVLGSRITEQLHGVAELCMNAAVTIREASFHICIL